MDVIVFLGGGAGALVAIGALLRGVWALNRRLVAIVDAVHDLVPDGGEALPEAVARIEVKLDEVSRRVKRLERKLDEHLLAARF